MGLGDLQRTLFSSYKTCSNSHLVGVVIVHQALLKSCKVENGFSGILNVNQVPPQHDDIQQSFFLAETLYASHSHLRPAIGLTHFFLIRKYLYLLFAPELINLDEWVFNTEAHPVRIHPVDTPYPIPY